MNNIHELIAQMTLEEKASLCSGQNYWNLKPIKRLNIPSILVTDGPHGLRKQITTGEQLGLNDSVPATCFPTASALAATWDRDLIFQVGQALAEECRQEKVAVILGPGANIKRSPLCGRNFEYFSEDPYLSGHIAKSHINGVQSLGIGTSLKHFAVNNQERWRMSINAIVDERALREIYLTGYEIAVKSAQPWTVMCSYNQINGDYACEHPHILKILKKEWNHEGIVVTDWGAMNDRIKALQAGLELEMPGVKNGSSAKIVEAVKSGELDETVLDQAVERILNIIFKSQQTLSNNYAYDKQAHHALARRVAAEGSVLLKNEQNALPLEKTARIALIGQFAKMPRFQGAGSSLINPSQLDNLFDEMVKISGEASITYAAGYPSNPNNTDPKLIEEALLAAKNADVVVVHAGLPDNFEVEGLDRAHLRLPASHNQLIEAVAGAHPNVVIVLSNGSPVVMPWLGHVQAVLEGYLGGQAGAGGLADVLFGIVNPSGKLAETFPLALEDTPAYHNFPGGPRTVEYRESLFVGYRFYETIGKDVLFPFGHGLSYTTFEYSDLKLNNSTITDQETLTVTFKIKNTGKTAGKEIAQIYISPQSPTVFRPKMELKGFDKVYLEPGEEKTLTIELNSRAFAYFNS
ncbi:MAG TPA: glycoside hydrolase family 3 C-terminal domain-containing protein, partial [Anaerolineales bacterium]|nr:glycoside hydrolase family 3 C-terminal domain-containing protein [Anaerolineales bacterium]